MNYCATCGAPLPPSSQFCPRCGADLTKPAATVAATPPPPATHHVPPPVTPAPAAPRVPPAATAPATPVAPKHRAPWWIVPLVIVGVVVIAFLLLLGLPFGGREETPRAEVVQSDTIAEGSPVSSPGPVSSGTLIDVGEEPPPAPATTTTSAVAAPPPVTTTTVAAAPPPVTTTTAAAPPVSRPLPSTPPPVRTEPPPVRTEPPPSTARGAGEISEEEAISTLRGYINTRDYYRVGRECISVVSSGYQNVGYTMDVHDSCAGRRLGRWRVDSKTREVFRQREDGRFLRP